MVMKKNQSDAKKYIQISRRKSILGPDVAHIMEVVVDTWFESCEMSESLKGAQAGRPSLLPEQQPVHPGFTPYSCCSRLLTESGF